MNSLTPEQLDAIEIRCKLALYQENHFIDLRSPQSHAREVLALIQMARRALELQGQTALLRGLLADVALSENGLCRFCLEKWSTHDCDVAKALGEA